MGDKQKDLPAKSEVNTKKSDTQHKQQDEYATPAQHRSNENEEGQTPKPQTKPNATGNRGRDQHPQ